MSVLKLSGVHHINLTVTDLETSGKWYKGVLGLQTGWEMDDVDGRGHKLVLLVPNSPLRIVLTNHKANTGEPASEFRTGLDHVAFAVETRDELENWQARLDDLNVSHSGIKEGATGWLITLRDPDNIQVELYSRVK